MPEFGTDRAKILRDGPDLLTAPDIIRIEVAAAIVRRARTGGVSAEEARLLLADWMFAVERHVLGRRPSSEFIDEACDMPLVMSHARQDCLSLGLARRHDALMVTADRRFAERSAAHHDRIELLAAT